MKLSERLWKPLRVSLIFISLAVVLITPGVMHCSGSVDPEGSAKTLNLI